MKAKKPDPTREWKKESTVFADVEAMKLGTASARVYDCAGQVTEIVLVWLCICSADFGFLDSRENDGKWI